MASCLRLALGVLAALSFAVFPTVRFTSPDGSITTGTVASGGASFTALETVTGATGQNSDVTITLTGQ